MTIIIALHRLSDRYRSIAKMLTRTKKKGSKEEERLASRQSNKRNPIRPSDQSDPCTRERGKPGPVGFDDETRIIDR